MPKDNKTQIMYILRELQNKAEKVQSYAKEVNDQFSKMVVPESPLITKEEENQLRPYIDVFNELQKTTPPLADLQVVKDIDMKSPDFNIEDIPLDSYLETLAKNIFSNAFDDETDLRIQASINQRTLNPLIDQQILESKRDDEIKAINSITFNLKAAAITPMQYTTSHSRELVQNLIKQYKKMDEKQQNPNTLGMLTAAHKKLTAIANKTNAIMAIAEANEKIANVDGTMLEVLNQTFSGSRVAKFFINTPWFRPLITFIYEKTMKENVMLAMNAALEDRNDHLNTSLTDIEEATKAYDRIGTPAHTKSKVMAELMIRQASEDPIIGPAKSEPALVNLKALELTAQSPSTSPRSTSPTSIAQQAEIMAELKTRFFKPNPPKAIEKGMSNAAQENSLSIK